MRAASRNTAAVHREGVARECHVERKVVEDYFSILDDLLLAVRLPVFSRRAKRRLVTHPKFYFFDVGVYRALRPRGPLDIQEEIEGPAMETLVLRELRALNDVLDLGYRLSYWRTGSGLEVDFVLYGERGLHAIEVKRATRVPAGDLRGLRAFLDDHPKAKAAFVYGGTERLHEGEIEVVPLRAFLQELRQRL